MSPQARRGPPTTPPLPPETLGSMQGRDTVVRGLLAGAVATTFALLLHLAAGGTMPAAPGFLLPLGLSLLVGVLLSGRRLSVVRLAATAVASQVLFHSLFVLGTAPAAGMSHAHHGGPAPAPELLGGPDPMVVAHLTAAALTTVVLHRGETLLGAVSRQGARAVSCLLCRIPRTVTTSARSARQQPGVHVIRTLLDQRHGGARSTRGPPAQPAPLPAA